MDCTRRSVAFIALIAGLLAIESDGIISGPVQSVALTPTASPAAAQPSAQPVVLTGSNFPAGVIAPGSVTVFLQPQVPAAGPLASTTASSIVTVTGSTRLVTFTIPASLGLTAPTPYAVTLAGISATGVPFSSGGASALRINPPALVTDVTPAIAVTGSTATITLDGWYTDFVEGQTQALLGPGISVGGGTPGAFGPVTVTSPTRAVATVIIDPAAAAGPRTVQVRTGEQLAIRTNGLQVATPTVTELTPRLTVAAGGSGSLTVRIAPAHPSHDVHVAITSSDVTVAAGPAEVVIPPGATTATVAIIGGVPGGPVQVTATLNGTSAATDVITRDHPPPPILTEPLAEGTRVVSGNGVAFANVTVALNGAVLGTPIAGADGRFNLVVAPLTAGCTITATQAISGFVSPPSTPTIVVPRPPAPVLRTPLVVGDVSIAGTAVPGATLDVFDDVTSLATTLVADDGTFAAAVPALTSGQSVSVTQRVAGVVSIPSAPVRVVDIPPPPSVIAPLIEGGATLTGTGVPGETVEVSVDNHSAGTATVGEDGSWWVSLEAALIKSQHVSARQLVGTMASAFSTAITVAAGLPAPTVNAPAIAGQTAIGGTGVGGARVRVLVDTALAGTASVGSDGTWSLELGQPLVAGHAITARQTAAGSQGPSSSAMVVLAVPAAPVITAPLISGATVIDGIGISGARVDVFVGNGRAGSTIVPSTGHWSIVLASALAPGQTVTAVESVAGVAGSISPASTVASEPPPPNMTNTVASGVTTVSGTGVSGGVVEVFVDGVSRGTTWVGATGTWSLPLATALAAGQVTSARQIVAGIPGASYVQSAAPSPGTAPTAMASSATFGATAQALQIGTTYYVSASGNDDNAGTSPGSGAWKTLNKVNGVNFGPGDRILFEGGQSFSGTLSLNQNDAGTSNAPIVISSFGSGRATINAGNSWGFYASDVAGVAIVNINFVGSGANNTGDGIAFGNDLAGDVRLSYVRIDNVDVGGFGQTGIILRGLNGKSGYSDVRITNSTSHDNKYAGVALTGTFSASSTTYAHADVYVGYTRTYNNTGYPASFGTGSGIQLSDVNGGIVERSVAYNNGINNTAAGGPVGIWTYDSNNVVIQYSESYGNHTSGGDGGGFDIDGGATNCVLQYNYSHDNDGAGFLLAQYPGARNFSNNIVRYNISQNDARKNSYGALMLWNGGSGVKNAEFYNNTVFVSPSPGTSPSAVFFMVPTLNIHLRNNVFVTTGGARLLEIASGQVGTLFQGNDYWPSGAAFSINWGGTFYNSLNAWRNATGQEKVGATNTGLGVDPRLASPGGGGVVGNAAILGTLAAYKLQSDSPMIDGGLNLPAQFGLDAGATDFYQDTLPQGTAFDVGAHERPVTSSDVSTPAVSVFAPLNNSLLFGVVTLAANAYDDVGVTSVQFKLDGSVIGSGAASAVGTYSFQWNAASAAIGTHVLTATASDAAGNQTESEGVVASVDGPPVIVSSAPSGTLPYGTTSTQVSVTTDVFSVCRFGLSPSTSYESLPFVLPPAAGGITHSLVAQPLTNGATYSFYVRCKDTLGTATVSDYILTFGVAASAPDATPPSVPGTVITQAVSASQINVAWSPSTDPQVAGQLTSGVASYRVLRNGNEIGVTPQPNFQDTGLEAATTYSYTIVAVDGAGNMSAPSTAATDTTVAAPDTTPPAVPTGLSVQVVSASQLTLTWAGSTDPPVVGQLTSGVASYRVLRDGALIATTTQLAHAESGLIPGTQYSYAVVAVDSAGNASAPSAAATGTTAFAPDTTPPSVPTVLVVEVTSSSQLALTWSGSTDPTVTGAVTSGVATYQVFRDGTLIATADQPTYADTGLAPATAYSYTVVAVDGAGNASAASVAATGTTASAPDTTPPAVPTGVTVQLVSATALTVTWTPSTDPTVAGQLTSGVASYRVFRDGLLITTTAQLTYADSGLVPETTSSYTVVAVDGAGNASAASVAATGTTASAPDTTPPAVPTGLAVQVVSATALTVTWTPSTDPTVAGQLTSGVASYRVFRDGVLVTTTTQLTYAETGLTPATTYSYTVIAVDGAGNASAPSTAATGTTSLASDTTPPAAPTGLAVQVVSSSALTLTWSASTDPTVAGQLTAGVASYRVFRDGVLVTTTTQLTYAEAGLTPATTYSYTVIAVDGAGNASVASVAATGTTASAPDTTPPAVPTGLAVQVVSSSALTLTWSASTDPTVAGALTSGVASYRVFRDGVLVTTTTQLTYAEAGLTPATTYSYTVIAVDGAGNASAPSTAATGTTASAPDATPPAVPTGLAVQVVSLSALTLTWSASIDPTIAGQLTSGVASYRVFRDGLLITTTAQLTYADTGLAPATTYSYTVIAVDGAGNASAPSTAATVTTASAPDATPPAVPTGLAVQVVSSSALTLTWSASIDPTIAGQLTSGVASYRVFRDGLLITTTAQLTYADTGLAPATTYSYTVIAVDGAGNASAASVAATGTTASAADTTPPAVPTGLAVQVVSSSALTLTWSASIDPTVAGQLTSGVASYRVFRDGLLITTTAQLTYAETGLTPAVTYSYTVVAVDGAGNASAASTAATGTTASAPDTTPPAVPIGLAVQVVSSSALTLTWSASTDPTVAGQLTSGVASYRVFRDGLLITTTAQLTYADSGLAPATTYSYTVVAVDGAGNASAPSTAATGTTASAPDTTPPAVPIGLAVQVVSSSALTLTWSASIDPTVAGAVTSGVASYRIFREGVLIATTAQLTYADSGLAPATTYSYTVVAVDGAGNASAPSTAATGTTASAPDTTPPAVPIGLAVQVVSSSALTLTWSASIDPTVAGAVTSGVASYRIFREGVLIATTAQSTLADTGLTPATTYSYTVVAVDGAGNASVASTAATGTTASAPDTTPPAVPTGLAVQVVSSSALTLTWSASTDPTVASALTSGVASYRVFRDGVLVTTTTQLTYAETGLTPATTYSYTVIAVDGAGNASAASTAATGTTASAPDTTPPAVPTGVTVQVVSATALTVTWTPSTDPTVAGQLTAGVASYRVFRDGVLVTTTTQLTYAETGLTPATTYSYTVIAVDGAGNASAASVAATGTTASAADTTPPAVPTGLAVQVVSATALTVTWTPSTDPTVAGQLTSGVASYRVFRDGVLVTTTTQLTYAETGLTPATTYSYTVVAVDGAGNASVASVAATGTTASAPDTTPPAVPTGVTVQVVSATALTVTWTPSTDPTVAGQLTSGVASYRVFRDGLLITTTAQLTYAETGLTPATTYSYTVVAVDGAGNASAASTAATGTTASAPDTTPPAVPTGVTVQVVSATALTVTWTPSTDPTVAGQLTAGVASYRVFRDGVLVTTTTQLTYAETGLTPATTYSYTVIAVDGAGNASAASVAATGTTASAPDTTPPAVPTGLAVQVVSATALTVTWTPSTNPTVAGQLTSGVASYRVFRDGVLVTTTTQLTYAETGLTPATTYSYTVIAVDGAGNASAPSTAATGTTASAPDATPPAVPTGLAVQVVSSSALTLTWSASIDPTIAGQLTFGVASYRVFRDGLLITTTAQLTYADTGLAPATTYSYTVIAVDGAGNASAPSTAATGTTSLASDTTPPAAPTGLAVQVVSSSALTLTWSASTDPTVAGQLTAGVASYRVFRDGVLVTTTTQLTYAETGLTPATTYSYTVVAVDGAGNASAASVAATGTTASAPDTTPPAVPTGLAVQVVSATALTVTWTPSTDPTVAGQLTSGVASYRVFRDGVLVTTTTQLTYAETGLTPATTYSYTVVAVDGAGNASAPSTAATGTTSLASDTTPPAAPTGLAVQVVSSSALTLTWSASTDPTVAGALTSGVASYRVFRDGVLVTTTTQLTYAETGLTPATTYSYTVIAVDGAGNASAPSTAATGTTAAAPDTTPPAVPTGVTVQVVSATALTVTWTPSTDPTVAGQVTSGVASYRVFRDGVLVTTTTQLTYAETGLTPATTYSYTVIAVDGAGNASAASVAATGTTASAADTTPPAVPTGLAVQVVSATALTVTWTPSTDPTVAGQLTSGVASYRVFRDGVLVTTTTQLTYAETGLTPATTYSYTVVAVDGAGNASVASVAATGTTASAPDTTPPAVPTGVTVQVVSATALTVTWTPSTDPTVAGQLTSGVASYRVFREGVLIATTAQSTLADTGLTPATTSSYTVVAVDGAGNASAASTAATGTTASAPDTTPPAVPTGVTVQVVSATALTVTWTPSTDPTVAGQLTAGVASYRVFRDGVLVTTTTQLTYAETGLTPATTYSYTVIAVDGAGNASAPSTAATGTTSLASDTTPPAAPTGLAVQVVSSSALTLTWSASTDPTVAGALTSGVASYRVFRDGVLVTTTTQLTYAETGLTPATTYSYTVIAVDGAGNASAASVAATGTTASAADTTPPAVPTGLAVQVVSSSALTLTWSASIDPTVAGQLTSGVASYRVFRDGLLITTTAQLTYAETGLTPAVTYSYTVVAVDGAGNASAASTAATGTTASAPDTTPPAVPIGLAVQVVSSSALTLTWSASTDPTVAGQLTSGVASYRVFRDGLPITTTAQLTYAETGLTPAVTYSYTVVAVDGAGNASAASTAATGTTASAPDTTPPAVPIGLAVQVVSSSALTLTWSASTDPTVAGQLTSGVASYRVFRDGLLITTTAQLTYADTGLAPATTYSYTVIAVDGAGNASAPSTAATGTTSLASDTTPPAAPTGLAVQVVSSSQLTLTWTASTDPNVAGAITSGVASYRVFRNGTLIATTAQLTYADTGLSPGTQYAYRVAAVDGAGNASAQSAQVTGTTTFLPDTTPPSVPAGLAVQVNSTTQLTLTWAASTDPSVAGAVTSGVASYRVFRNGTLIATTAQLTYSNTGLNPGTQYAYKVAAVDVAGNASAQSAQVTGTTTFLPDTTAPSVPTGLAVQVNSTSQLTLTWSASSDPTVAGAVTSGVASYRVFRNGTLITTTAQLTYADTGLNPGTQYAYRVAAVDGAGNASAQSAQVTGTTTFLPDTTPPTVPAVLPVQANSASQLTVTWSASTDPTVAGAVTSGVASYRVFRNGVQIGTTAQRTYSDSGLAASTQYSYTVAAVDGAGNVSAQSAAATGTTKKK